MIILIIDREAEFSGMRMELRKFMGVGKGICTYGNKKKDCSIFKNSPFPPKNGESRASDFYICRIISAERPIDLQVCGQSYQRLSEPHLR